MNMFKKSFAAAAMFLAVFTLVAFAQSGSVEDQIAQLRLDLANFGLRLSTLEHAGGAAPDASSGGSAASPSRTMVLVSISNFHDDTNAGEIKSLKRDCSSLMATVNSKVEQTAADAGTQTYTAHVRGGTRGWGGYSGGGVSTSNVGAVGTRVENDAMLTNRYATMHAMKKEKLEALQRAESEPKQLIHGHNDNVIFTLETKHNLSDALNNIAIGDTVTWTGTRTSADQGAESWRIESIKKVK
jgi:hypothetical protein